MSLLAETKRTTETNITTLVKTSPDLNQKISKLLKAILKKGSGVFSLEIIKKGDKSKNILNNISEETKYQPRSILNPRTKKMEKYIDKNFYKERR